MDSSNYHVECKRASPSSSSTINEELKEQKKIVVRYKECLKNHAASMGGHAIDGCGEFISLEEDGSLEAFKCSACNCHRNFHRKEIQCYYSNSSSSNTFCYSSDQHYLTPLLPNTPQITSPIILDHLLLSPKKSGSNLSDQSHDRDSNRDHGEEDHRNHHKEVGKPGDEKVTMKKRFRTKFSAEQKEKMMRFAEKVGWKIQKLEESVVQKFCEEIGIKRRVLRVWLHNNKNTYAKNLRTTG